MDAGRHLCEDCETENEHEFLLNPLRNDDDAECLML